MRKRTSFLVTLSILICGAVPVSAAVAGNSGEDPLQKMQLALIGIIALFSLLLIAAIVCLASGKGSGSIGKVIRVSVYITTALVFVVLAFCAYRYVDASRHLPVQVPETTVSQISTNPPTVAPPETSEPTDPPTEPTTLPPPTEPDYLETFAPEMTENSNPDNWKIKWEILNAGNAVSDFEREEPISFGKAEDYFALPGVSAFRGNNFRNGSTYGTALVTDKTISAAWSANTGYLSGKYGNWSGNGWTGQPLIVQWDDQTRAIMNLYEDKKAKEGLVEVIYPSMDGKVHFLDLDDGSRTRDPINVGMTFKGAGALDPRGYPLLYVGAGDYLPSGKSPRMFVISLIDGQILYEKGQNDRQAYRSWHAFDSGPLVSAETDTLIWPGESGLLYSIKLNTSYDKAAGTISVAPDDPVVTRYSTKFGYTRYIGYECSAVAVGNYLYLSENGGFFYCIDLNTMELIWCQDTKDDSNSTPVFEWGEDGRGYLYTAPSLHWTNVNGWGNVSIYKLDAQTGEIIWEKPYKCGTISDLSGGVQGSPLLGKEGTSIEGLIIYPIARTPNLYDSTLAALDTETGEEVWTLHLSNYTWSSPVAVYTEAGDAYVIICDTAGNMFFIDGVTGKILDTVNLGSNVEASPAVFKNTIVVGTRGTKIYGVKVK